VAPKHGEGAAHTAADPSDDDSLPPPDDEAMLEWGTPPMAAAERTRAESDGGKSGGEDGAPDDLQDMLADLHP